MDSSEKRWSKAHQELVDRWRTIIDRIHAHDEGAVLTMSNVMDEFCDEANAEKMSTPPRSDSVQEISKSINVLGGVDSRCFFCRGFTDIGGCLGDLDALNEAVTSGRWERAREVAEEYLSRLESMRIDPAPALLTI